jgi:hypothetical protein
MAATKIRHHENGKIMYISKTILLLSGLCLMVAILFTCNQCHPPNIQGGSEQVDTLEWVNGSGDIVTSLKASPEYFAKAKQEVIDSMAKAYKTKVKNVIEYVTVTTEGNNDVKPSGPVAADYFPVDTNKNCPPQIKSLRQAFSSPYYKAVVQVGDSSYMHLQSFDTVTVLWKKVKEGSIFNRRNLIQLDVSTANPDTKVSGIKAYRIYEKPKRWAIGIQFGYGLSNSMRPAPFVGIGITKSIIRF